MDLLPFHWYLLQEYFVPRHKLVQRGCKSHPCISPARRGSDAVESPKGTVWLKQRIPTGCMASGGFEMRI